MKTRMNCASPRFPFALTLLAMALATAMPAYAQPGNLDVADTGLLSHNGTLDKNAADAEHVFTTDTTITATDSTYDGLAITVDSCVLLVESDHTFAGLTLINGAVVGAPNEVCGLKLTITGDVTVDSTSEIAAPANCQGASGGECVQYYAETSMMCDYFKKAGSGGGHGGDGGDAGDAGGGGTHGDPFRPVTVGGAGGCWGDDLETGSAWSYGGGTIQLIVGGILRVDGLISADGEDGEAGYFSSDEVGEDCYSMHWYAGGGAGGSILLVANSLAASGTISASGGLGADNYATDPDGGDGGGGRVAIHYATEMSFLTSNVHVDGFEQGTVCVATVEDCDGNGVWDVIELSNVSDCNGNGSLDVCEIAAGAVDCNNNLILDLCEIASGASEDCNSNGIPDECEMPGNDCNGNSILDSCEAGGQVDCNENSIPDICDLFAGVSEDCDGNGVPDECDSDCNTNGYPDACDIAAGASADSDENGIPDECTPSYWVDDDAPNDPGSGDPAVSDPLEDGSLAHPFDSIQEVIDAMSVACIVEVANGTYTGLGNKNIDFQGKVITLRSASGDPTQCIIDCEGDGRGFYFHSGEGPDSIVEGLTIVNGSLEFNSPQGSGGGGVYCISSSPTFRDCAIRSNIAASRGGGMLCEESSSPTLTNCTVSGNEAGHGGGVYCTGSGNLVLTNCTIIGNSAGFFGGGIYCTSDGMVLTNCTISQNSAGSRGGGIYYSSTRSMTMTNCILWGDTPEEICSRGSKSMIRYCDIQGGWPWTGTGNIDANPLFGDADGPDDVPGTVDDNLRLTLGSPCMDAGDNDAIPERVLTDAYGNDRIRDGDEDGVPMVDMGAYEYQAGMSGTDCNANGIPDSQEDDFDADGLIDDCDADVDGDGVLNGNDVCPETPVGVAVDATGRPIGDSDDDCQVTLTDYAGFESCLLLSGPNVEPASVPCLTVFDFDGDGDVDLIDFANFQVNFNS